MLVERVRGVQASVGVGNSWELNHLDPFAGWLGEVLKEG